jgi:hypothetical protein
VFATSAESEGAKYPPLEASLALATSLRYSKGGSYVVLITGSLLLIVAGIAVVAFAMVALVVWLARRFG